MTPLEDARTLSGNCPSGAFSNLSTYWQTPGSRNLRTVDDYAYAPISFLTWQKLQANLNANLI